VGDRFRFEQAIAAIDAANADDPDCIEFRGEATAGCRAKGDRGYTCRTLRQ
jgi:hypothetical protein